MDFLFVNSEILGMHIWRKNEKFEIATNCVNQIFNLNAFFFFLFTGATGYYHTICLVKTYLYHLQTMKMTFLKLFLISTFKNSNLAEKLTNLAENL